MRIDGDWEGWLKFFLTGVMETAEQAAQAAKLILQLFEADRVTIQTLGKAAISALRLHEYMKTKPLLLILQAAKALKLTIPTVTQSLENLRKLGIVREITGKKRGRIFIYAEYLNILSRGTEPL